MMRRAGALGGVFVSRFLHEGSQILPIGLFPGCDGEGD